MLPAIKIIETEKAPCAWLAKQDRSMRNAANSSIWTKQQMAEISCIEILFVETFGSQNVVLNVNKKFFTFKVFTTKKANSASIASLKAELLKRFKKPYEIKMNQRNEILYNVCPNP